MACFDVTNISNWGPFPALSQSGKAELDVADWLINFISWVAEAIAELALMLFSTAAPMEADVKSLNGRVQIEPQIGKILPVIKELKAKQAKIKEIIAILQSSRHKEFPKKIGELAEDIRTEFFKVVSMPLEKLPEYLRAAFEKNKKDELYGFIQKKCGDVVDPDKIVLGLAYLELEKKSIDARLAEAERSLKGVLENAAKNCQEQLGDIILILRAALKEPKKDHDFNQKLKELPFAIREAYKAAIAELRESEYFLTITPECELCQIHVGALEFFRRLAL